MRLNYFKFFILFFFFYGLGESLYATTIHSDAYLPEVGHWYFILTSNYEREKIEYDKAAYNDYEKQRRKGANLQLGSVYRLSPGLALGGEVGTYLDHETSKYFTESQDNYLRKDKGMTPFKFKAIWRLPDEHFAGLQRDFLFMHSFKMSNSSVPSGKRRAHDFHLGFRFALEDSIFDATGLFYLKFAKDAETYQIDNGRTARADDYSSFGALFSAHYHMTRFFGIRGLGGLQRDANHEVWDSFSDKRSTNGWTYLYGAEFLYVLSEKMKLTLQARKEEGYYFLTVQDKRDKIEIERDNFSLSFSYAL